MSNNFDFQGDTTQINSLGNTIQEYAGQYQSKITNIYEEIGAIRNVWSGGDSESYLTNIDSKKDALESLGHAISDYGQFLKDTSASISNFRANTAENAKKL